MTTLVLGASGATGILLVEQLLQRDLHVRAIVRSSAKLPQTLMEHPRLSLIETSIADATDAEMTRFVDGCDAVASCLGHNLTLKGIFGRPRRLVTEATQRVCLAAQANASSTPTKFVLMNTAGNSNRDLNEPISWAQRCIMVLLRNMVPPHRDNEMAADHLRTAIGPTSPSIEWVVVRPDTLTNAPTVTQYTLHPSPTRSAIFNAGESSRINVAHFMAEMIADADTWNRWKGQMPVLYNVA
ncbi:NAD(P)-dependent oxidoreductase [Aureliella helgolandensis]|nr:NAD(P)-binding oxidoreductase [Aureliella helgolandensis]